MSDEKIAEMLVMTTDVVSAYVANNKVSTSELVGVIKTVFDALSIADAEGSSEPPVAAVPAVSIKKSVTPDAIVCLDCGKPMKMLRRHLASDHGLSIDDYRNKWQLSQDYPTVAPNYSATRSAHAKKIGLGQKPKAKRERKPKAS